MQKQERPMSQELQIEMNKHNWNTETNLILETKLDEVCEEMKRLCKENKTHLNEKLFSVADEIKKRLYEISIANTNEIVHINEVDAHQNKTTKLQKNKKLPDKQFVARESVCTVLWETEHGRSFRNLFVAMFIFKLLHMIMRDLFTTGTLSLHAKYFIVAFSDFHLAIGIWLLMFICTLLIHPLFNIWANCGLYFPIKSIKQKLWDISFVCAFVCYICAVLYFPVRIMVLAFNIYAIASKAVILLEQIRMLMKMYAFVRSTAPRVLNRKPCTDQNETCLPKFSQYLYFLFAPTLIYKDSYPRTNVIRWRVVIVNFSEVVGIMFMYGYILELYLAKHFNDYGIQKYTWKDVFMIGFSVLLPTIFIYISFVYLLLHSWMNAWAEMLRFADRMFYGEWWTLSSFYNYYRLWNSVIYDWLYTYIYKDMYEIVTRSNRIVSTLTVFALSSIVHEYIITCLMGCFYPVLFLLFGVSGTCVKFLQIKKRRILGNIFMWMSIITGTTILCTLYTTEFYARVNCNLSSRYKYQILDYIVPYSWFC